MLRGHRLEELSRLTHAQMLFYLQSYAFEAEEKGKAMKKAGREAKSKQARGRRGRRR